MNVLRASVFNTSSSPVGSLASSMPQRASTKRTPIPIHVKRFLVRHRRPARMRAQRAKGKANFLFFETTISSSFPSSSTRLSTRFVFIAATDEVRCCQSIYLWGFTARGRNRFTYCIIFFRSFVRSLAKSRVRRAKVTHCRKFIGPTILTMTWPTDRVQNTHRARKHTHKTVV